MDITETHNGWKVEVTIRSTPEEADKAIVKYMEDFSPYGYGTRVTGHVLMDGNQITYLERARSCD